MVKMSGTICDDERYEERDEEELEDECEDECEEDGVLAGATDSEDAVDADDAVDSEDKPQTNIMQAADFKATASRTSNACVEIILDDISDAERTCSESELRVSRCRSELKSAKSEYEDAVLHLRELCQAIQNDAERPLMPAFKEAEAGGGVAEVESFSEQKPDWRSAPLSDLAIPDGVLSKLYESSVETVGELEDLRAEISTGKAKWPKGIGAAKVTVIEDAVIQWLTVNQG